MLSHTNLTNQCNSDGTNGACSTCGSTGPESPVLLATLRVFQADRLQLVRVYQRVLLLSTEHIPSLSPSEPPASS
ncbi:hypothetical protein EHS25_004614 [Saitozyma podzolica]|uniref:Uncharacterized protein n=1 Tax=Saitozyma podzolica TaxID=1890683 RepID=A0A427YUJ3_9TREE|nr:hypothetical protein EHS25_004614 [Saitozyma podzolica]